MELHSSVVTIMWFIKFPLWHQQNYGSMLSPPWSKAVCMRGCECAPSSIVASFKLEASLTRAGDLAQHNNWPHHMRSVHHTPDSGCIWRTTLVSEYAHKSGQIPPGVCFWILVLVFSDMHQLDKAEQGKFCFNEKPCSLFKFQLISHDHLARPLTVTSPSTTQASFFSVHGSPMIPIRNSEWGIGTQPNVLTNIYIYLCQALLIEKLCTKREQFLLSIK